MKIDTAKDPIPVVKMQDRSNTQASVHEAAEGFETLLTHQLVQELQKDLEGESMFGSGVEGHTIGAMAEWELATHLAKTLDTGIEKQLLAMIAARKGEQ